MSDNNMTYVRSHWRRIGYGYRSVRYHYRRKTYNTIKTNFFYSEDGAFIGGGISKKYGPYLTLGYKNGPVKLRTSIGLQGHKASVSLQQGRNTEVGIERNLTTNQTGILLRNKSKKYNIPLPNR